MKFVKLLGYAYVNGASRSPAEGILHLDDAEAQRLIDSELAVDVSADFTAKDHKSVPVETISGSNSAAPTPSLAPVNPQLAPSIPVKPDQADQAA